MSYSFSVRGKTSADLVANAAAKFDAEVLPHQPAHKVDRQIMLDTLPAVAGVLTESADGSEFSATVSGSIGGAWVGNEMPVIRSCNLSINVTRAAPAQA